MSFKLAEILAHPLTKGMSVDDPRTTDLRAQIVREKNFLRHIYEAWYKLLIDYIPQGDDAIVEIGSGAGFLKEICKELVTSEVFFIPKVDIIFNAMSMPFKAGALRATLLVDVLHHIPDPSLFFAEAARCVQSGGRCLLVEPWNTRWSRWVYQHLHHEPFDPNGNWSIPSSGPLSGANSALPWILFERDRELFSQRFPEWRISCILPMMPVVYLVSGGISMRSFVPGWSYKLFRGMETCIANLDRKFGMFAFIVLDRN